MTLDEAPKELDRTALLRNAWFLDRLTKGWNPDAAHCVMIALEPFGADGDTRVKKNLGSRRFIRGIVKERHRFDVEILDLGERDSLIAAANALAAYMTVARRFCPEGVRHPAERLWEETIHQIMGILESPHEPPTTSE